MEDNQEVKEIQIGEPGKAVGEPTKLSTPVAILLAGAMITLAVVFTHYAPSQPAPTISDPTTAGQIVPTTPTPAPAAVNIKNVSTESDPYIGNPNAKVTIAYWSDYQCPYCKMFETTVLPSVITKYVDTGEAKIVFKDFSFLGPDSDTAALNARAIWNLYPAQYFAWRTAMFKAQDQEGNVGFGNQASITKLTGTISGIDVNKVAQAISKNQTQYKSAIDADRAEGESFGVQGTPGFIIGTQLITGVDTLANFSKAIDTAAGK